MKRHSVHAPGLPPLLMGGLMLAFVGVLLDIGDGSSDILLGQQPQEACQGEIQPQVSLSREQLALVLTVPERDRRTRVTDVIGPPYCQLQQLQVRAGVVAERHVYPLAFDPATRLVILYEGDEYAGYEFSF